MTDDERIRETLEGGRRAAAAAGVPKAVAVFDGGIAALNRMVAALAAHDLAATARAARIAELDATMKREWAISAGDIADEREACALIADAELMAAQRSPAGLDHNGVALGREIAAAIRARTAA